VIVAFGPQLEEAQVVMRRLVQKLEDLKRQMQEQQRLADEAKATEERLAQEQKAAENEARVTEQASRNAEQELESECPTLSCGWGEGPDGLCRGRLIWLSEVQDEIHERKLELENAEARCVWTTQASQGSSVLVSERGLLRGLAHRQEVLRQALEDLNARGQQAGLTEKHMQAKFDELKQQR
jgi:hypothetical protein